jgi:hypothetical protein
LGHWPVVEFYCLYLTGNTTHRARLRTVNHARCKPATTVTSILQCSGEKVTNLVQLTVHQLVKKLPAFYGIQRFIPPFMRTHHFSLS